MLEIETWASRIIRKSASGSDSQLTELQTESGTNNMACTPQSLSLISLQHPRPVAVLGLVAYRNLIKLQSLFCCEVVIKGRSD